MSNYSQQIKALAEEIALESSQGENTAERVGNAIDVVGDAIGELEGGGSDIETRLTTAVSDIDTLKTDVETLQTSDTSQNSRISTNASDIATLRSQGTTLAARVDTAAGDIENLQEADTTFDERLTALEHDGSDVDIDIPMIDPYYIKNDGTKVDGSNQWRNSGKISVSEGDEFSAKLYGYNDIVAVIAMYDSEGVFLPSHNVTGDFNSTITIPAGVSYVCFCSRIDGDSRADVYVTQKINNNEKIEEEISELQNIFDTLNLLDTDSEYYMTGVYLSGSGFISNNSHYAVSNFIPTSSGKTYSVCRNGALITNGGKITLYNKYGVFIEDINAQTNNPVTVPSNDEIKYIRFSIANYDEGDTIITEGSTPVPFVEYGVKTLGEESMPASYSKVKNRQALLLNTNQPHISFETLTDSTEYICECNSIKSQSVITARFEIDSNFTSVSVGKQSGGITIYSDNTYSEYGSSTKKALGFTLTDYVSVKVTLDFVNGVTAEIMTNGGSANVVVNANKKEVGGKSFVTVSGTITNLYASHRITNIDKTWVFVDSYGTIFDEARWPYYCLKDGKLNFLLIGYPGANSGQIRPDFQIIAQHGRPQKVVWCLGMNDDYNTYVKNVKYVSDICDANGIELILCTIPTTASHNRNDINTYVKASGRRYVDQFVAVGDDTSGNWFSGMLDSDGVHPTSEGAKALYSMFMASVPELNFHA